MTTLPLVTLQGQLADYTLSGRTLASEPRTDFNRIAYSAAHVVADPRSALDPWLDCAVDWDATLAYRHHLWSLGLGVAEAMDTAQRGMGLDWPTSLELIRRTLSDVLNRAEIHDPDLNRMSITVGEVSCSPDLKVATVYVMPLMGSVSVEDAIAALARNKAELRRRVSAEMTLKYAPDLRFRPDETFDRLDETRRLFSDEKVQRDIAAGDADDGDD